jgi:hypothetical protein
MRCSIRVSVALRWALLIVLPSAAVAGQERIDFDRLSLEQGLSQRHCQLP